MPEADTVPENLPRTSRRSKTAVVMDWGGKSLLALIPALATGYFAMKQAKFESEVEIARINAKASTGYETLVTAFKKLEDRAEEHERVIRELSESVRSQSDSVGGGETVSRVRGPQVVRRVGRGAVGVGAGSVSVVSSEPAKVGVLKKLGTIELPDTLDGAVQLKAGR